MSQLNSQLYPYLLSPLKVGAHTLPNRVIMGSLHTRLENEPDGVHRLAEFYAARARGGVGLIVTGGVSPNFEGRVEQGAWVLDSPEQLVDHTPKRVQKSLCKSCIPASMPSMTKLLGLALFAR